LFYDLEEASRFFQAGSSGYSESADPSHVDGVMLCTTAWRIEPLELDGVSSSFFENPDLFPLGSAELDCGLVMLNVPVTWQPLSPMKIELQSRRKQVA
jgi:hypothetical protein